MSKNRKSSRRDFLRDGVKAAMFLPAVDTVFASLLKSQIMTAHAQTGTAAFKQFLHVDLFYAPPRWAYDLFLDPGNDQGKFISNPMVSNAYAPVNGGAYIDTRFRQIAFQGKMIPLLWSFDVPTRNGGTTKASELLKHMLNIRGIEIKNIAHPGASALHQAAIVGQPTMGSVLADKATANLENPIENMVRATALNPGGGNVYASKKGSQSFRYSVLGGGVNNLTTMFDSLRPISNASGFSMGFVGNRGALQDKLEQAMKSLAPNDSRYYTNLLENSEGSLKILSGNTVEVFSQLANEWDELYQKYLTLIQRTLAGTYPGINDQRVGRTPKDAAERRTYQWRTDIQITHTDVATNTDLRSAFKTVDYTTMAAQFAVTEFLMTRKICPSISLTPDAFDDLLLNGSQMKFIFDQHEVGNMPGVLFNTLFYLSLTSCMIELIDSLKTGFNDTLIYMASEFDRLPRKDGSGSDHATSAHVSLISGRQAEFKIIGNIYSDGSGKGTNYAPENLGTWGHSAPLIGNKHLALTQVWASMLRTLGMPLSEIPNAIDKSALLFNAEGSLALASAYDKTPQIIKNVA